MAALALAMAASAPQVAAAQGLVASARPVPRVLQVSWRGVNFLQDGAAKQPPAPDATTAQPPTADEIISATVLEPLRVGLENGNLKQAMTAFDPKATPNYPDVRDQLGALLNNFGSVRLRYKLLQLNLDSDAATATCEIDMDATPRDETLITRRRSAEMRMKLKQTSAGWKIVSFTPADFFGQ